MVLLGSGSQSARSSLVELTTVMIINERGNMRSAKWGTMKPFRFIYWAR